MFSFRKCKLPSLPGLPGLRALLAFRALAAGLGCAAFSLTSAWAQVPEKFPGVGRAATPKEVAAWDIDVRPDFKGLPKGAGTVAKGQEVWESKCASCHGVFGESNEVFSPLVGGTSAEDVKTGRVARLKDGSYPGRTTLMKLATVSTLWDYINRAMPWTQPKSLTTEEVYAVTAFLLNLGGVVPDDFTLSDQTMATAQARMPNRNGMSTAHALWPGKELGGTARPDVQASACMKNCAVEVKVASLLPDYARNAHGNLAEQNRPVGAQHGADTTRPESGAATGAQASAGAPQPAVSVAAAPQAAAAPPSAAQAKPADQGGAVDAKAAVALANKYSCTACHGATQKIVGPAFSELGKKYAGQVNYLMEKIVKGGSGVWGPVPMPPQSLPAGDARALAQWLAAGAPR
jgi:S-disulfanyl-L-cysteine oxidoreductase SoxD